MAWSFSQHRQRRDSRGRLVEDVFSFLIFSSDSADHLTEKCIWTVTSENHFELRANALAVIADPIHETLSGIKSSYRCGPASRSISGHFWRGKNQSFRSCLTAGHTIQTQK